MPRSCDTISPVVLDFFKIVEAPLRSVVHARDYDSVGIVVIRAGRHLMQVLLADERGATSLEVYAHRHADTRPLVHRYPGSPRRQMTFPSLGHH